MKVKVWAYGKVLQLEGTGWDDKHEDLEEECCLTGYSVKCFG